MMIELVNNIETEAEKIALTEFRIKIQDLSDNALIPTADDHFLLRWLRARNLDLEKADQMLRNYVKWQQSNDYLKASINYKPPEYLNEKLQCSYTGFDNNGRVVIFLPIGRWQLRKVLENGYKEECYKLQYLRLNETLTKIEAQRKLYGVDKCVCVIDSYDLTFWKLASYETMQIILRFFKEFEAYYPELLHSAYIVNAPTVFTYIFNIVKPLLSSATLTKVKIFDFNQDKWKTALAEVIPLESIPIEYGGTGKKIIMENIH